MTIYFVRPSYLRHLKQVDNSVKLLGEKVKRPFLLVNATVRQASADFLVPLTTAKSTRLRKVLQYEDLTAPALSMGTAIYDCESKAPVSIARPDWMVPYNAEAVKKLKIDDLFEGHHKTELQKILRALRDERTGYQTETGRLLASRTQQMVEMSESLRQHEWPKFAKLVQRAKDYKAPNDEVFEPMDTRSYDEMRQAEAVCQSQVASAEQTEPKPVAKKPPSKLVTQQISYAEMAKAKPLSDPRAESEAGAESPRTEQKASVLNDQIDQNNSMGSGASAGEEQASTSELPSVVTSSRRRPLRRVKLVTLSSQPSTFAAAASSQAPSSAATKEASPSSSTALKFSKPKSS